MNSNGEEKVPRYRFAGEKFRNKERSAAEEKASIKDCSTLLAAFYNDFPATFTGSRTHAVSPRAGAVNMNGTTTAAVEGLDSQIACHTDAQCGNCEQICTQRSVSVSVSKYVWH